MNRDATGHVDYRKNDPKYHHKRNKGTSLRGYIVI